MDAYSNALLWRAFEEEVRAICEVRGYDLAEYENEPGAVIGFKVLHKETLLLNVECETSLWNLTITSSHSSESAGIKQVDNNNETSTLFRYHEQWLTAGQLAKKVLPESNSSAREAV